MAEKFKHLYGPVPSRRLGLSLGVDIIPPKACSLDCVYCQIGRTPVKIARRHCHLPPEEILSEIKNAVAGGLIADFITVTGSGEPTLHSELGFIIDSIKNLTDIPVALLTNGTLLSDPEVRSDCAKADVVLPSLDAADEDTFQKINRPCEGITVESVISGLAAFRQQCSGRIWLEIFLIEGVNTSDEQIGALVRAVERIRPDKVHLNTAVRPTAEPGIRLVSQQKLHLIAERFGPNCEVIAGFEHHQPDVQGAVYTADHLENLVQSTLSMLERRPCSIDDIASGLDVNAEQARQAIKTLLSRAKVRSTNKEGVEFYYAPGSD